MWKNVSRRLKDGVERFGRTVISTSPNQSTNSPNCGDHVRTTSTTNESVTRFNCDGQRHEDERKRFKCKFGQGNLHHTWLGALTWSSAIICGWYTSQLVCLKSRRRHVDCNLAKSADEYRCKYYKLMLVPSRFLQSSLLSHFVFNAPANKSEPGSSIPSTPSSGYHSLRPYSLNAPFKVDLIAETDEFKSPEFEEASPQCGYEPIVDDEPKQQPDPILVATAVQNLLSVLGEMEFEMGVQNILTGNYSVAVEQLKQGAFHHNAGATFNLGLCFEQGLGCVKSMEKAAECYQVAAGLGHKKAMYNLAIFYLHGLGGLEKDRKIARRYFQAAANLGLAEAGHALAPAKQPLPEFFKPRLANEHFSLQTT